MPQGNPEAYMEQGVPPEEAMMMAGGPPPVAPDGMGIPAPAPDQDAMMMMLIEAVMGKWGSAEAQIGAEKDVLLQTLMQIAMPAPPVGPQDFAEGAPTGPVM